MTTFFSVSDQAVLLSDERVLQAAVAAYLGYCCSQSRLHTGSYLKIFLTWCAGQDLDPLRLGRLDRAERTRVGRCHFAIE